MISPIRRSIARNPDGYAEFRRVLGRHLGDGSARDLAASAALIVEAISASNVDGVRISLTVHDDAVEVEIRGVEARSIRDLDPPPKGSFAGWLRGQMQRRGLSHEGTARLVGVSVKTVSRWARSETEPRMRDLRRLHDAFGELPPMHTPAASAQHTQAEF
ncbi:MAG TPA: helix-turn-helix transcriptional regulator [Actinomycetota bacterium]|nr:helix-turn-helix transcriptional regulator [Actinomycetota bacterium]